VIGADETSVKVAGTKHSERTPTTKIYAAMSAGSVSKRRIAMDDKGRIYAEEEARKLPKKKQARLIWDIKPTSVQMARKPPRVGRNELCPCGSGKKFKHCHLRRV
jgi:uncharacterized protein YecA (UPF0149 family)